MIKSDENTVVINKDIARTVMHVCRAKALEDGYRGSILEENYNGYADHIAKCLGESS